MRCAFGKVVLTPPGGTERVPMAGYSRKHYANGKLDDIMCRGLLIEDQEHGFITKRMLILSMDILKLPLKMTEYIKEKIMEEVDFGLGPGQIILHATHTHSAPDLTGEFYWPGHALMVLKGLMFGANRNDKYIVWITRQIVKMAQEMIPKLVPAKMAWTKQKINSDVLINRRHPTRETKQDMGLLAVKSLESNKLIGLLVSFGMHPTSLSFVNDKLSADYPGRVCYRIEDQTSGNVEAVYVTGSAGDLNPITTCGTDFDTLEHDPKANQTVYEQYGTYKHTKKLGYYLGDQALKIANSLPDSAFYNGFSFTGYQRRFKIPVKDYQPYIYSLKNWLQNKVVYWLKNKFLFPIAMRHGPDDLPNFPGAAIKHYPFSLKHGQKINVYTELHYVTLKFYRKENLAEFQEYAILGIPGELFEDIEKRLLSRSPFPPENTMIFQLVSDWAGYLFPLSEYLLEPGYEPLASTSPLCGTFVESEYYKLWREIEHGVVVGRS